MTDTVECPLCETPFDAVAASTAGRPSAGCPHCNATWVELHRAVEPQSDPGYEIGFNGEIRRDNSEVEA